MTIIILYLCHLKCSLFTYNIIIVKVNKNIYSHSMAKKKLMGYFGQMIIK